MTPSTEKRAWWLPSPTSVRLIVGFLVPLAAFAVAALLSMRNMERLVTATDTIRGLQHGLEGALHMQNLARQQDAAQADLSLGEDLTTIERFSSARSQMRRMRLRLADVLETDTDRQLLWQSRRLESKLYADFRARFIPAVMDDDRERIRELRQEGSASLDEIITISERLARSIQAKMDLAAGHAEMVRHESVRNSGLLLAAAVLLAVAMALLTSRSVVKPIQRLITGTEAVARGRLDHTIELLRRDEFGQLAESFNRMTADLREHQNQLVQAQKMASLGQLAAGVAHEINNPIGVIMGYVDVLARDERLPPELRGDIVTIEEEARQCKRIVEDLLDLSRPVARADEVVDLAETLRRAASRVPQFDPESKIETVCEVGDGPLRVHGDTDKLRQVFDNLLRNAVQAMPGRGRLVLRAALRTAAVGDREQVEVEIEDTGCGMSEEQCERAFDPFFSTKTSGTGLGLSIVFSIIQAHQGHVTVRSAEGKGTTFVIALPRADAEPA